MIYYFDMDGTICDLERSFVDRTGIPISSFSAMSKEEKEKFLFFFFRHRRKTGDRYTRAVDKRPLKVTNGTIHIKVINHGSHPKFQSTR